MCELSSNIIKNCWMWLYVHTYAHVQYNISDSLWLSRLCITVQNCKFYEGGQLLSDIVWPLELDMEFLRKYNISVLSVYTSWKRTTDWYRLLMNSSGCAINCSITPPSLTAYNMCLKCLDHSLYNWCHSTALAKISHHLTHCSRHQC